MTGQCLLRAATGLAVGLALAWGVAPTAAWATPEQFQVWGRRAAADPYIGAPGLAPAPLDAAGATAEETARGFVLYAAQPSAVLRPDQAPAAGGRCSALDARDCPGQYGPATFSLFALADGDFSVEVADLSGKGGKIASDNLDVRAVRYAKVPAPSGPQTVPLLLESVGSVHVRAGCSQQFWITYYVPPDQPAGAYEGAVRILKGGVRQAELPLRLRVNGFALAGPDEDLYIYYDSSTQPRDLGLVAKELADQRCHGMTVSGLTPPVTDDGELTREAWVPLLDAYKAAGFPSPRLYVSLWNRITSEWLNTTDKSIGMWGAWFRYYPFSAALDERYIRTVRMMQEAAQERGLQIVLAVADEPGSHAWTIPAAQHYYDLVKAGAPGVTRELSVGGGWAMGQPEEALWRGRINIWTTNRWLPEKLAAVRAGDPAAEIAIYNMGGPGSAAGGTQPVRLFYGFFSWKARAGGAAQWVYRHSGTPDHNYVWPAADPSEGRVPTLHWEAAREGAKDRRYVATLEGMLEGRGGPAADAARRVLDEISTQVELSNTEYDPIAGGRIPAHPPGTYERWRSQIADAIEALQAATGPGT
jgi:hypothetical protein